MSRRLELEECRVQPYPYDEYCDCGADAVTCQGCGLRVCGTTNAERIFGQNYCLECTDKLGEQGT